MREIRTRLWIDACQVHAVWVVLGLVVCLEVATPAYGQIPVFSVYNPAARPPAIVVATSSLTLEFQEDDFPTRPPPASASGGFVAKVDQQSHGNYQVEGVLMLTAAGPQVNLSLTDVDILCQAEFCNQLTVTATFNATLLNAFPLALLDAAIDGRFEGPSAFSFAQVRVEASGVVLNAPITFAHVLTLDNNQDFNFPLLSVANPPAVDPFPNPGILSGQMTFMIIEGQGMDDHIMIPGSLDLTITAVPEPSAALAVAIGVVWAGRRRARMTLGVSWG